MKTRKLKALFLNEEWLIVLLGFVILAFIAIFPEFMYNIKMLNVKSLVTASGWINAAYTFVFLFLIILITTVVMKRPVKGLLVSFVVIFVLTMIAQLLASIPFCKEYGLESVLFAVLLGLIISNVFGVPEWMKPAIQSEFYIKIGIICLGATIIFGEIFSLKSDFINFCHAINEFCNGFSKLF